MNGCTPTKSVLTTSPVERIYHSKFAQSALTIRCQLPYWHTTLMTAPGGCRTRLPARRAMTFLSHFVKRIGAMVQFFFPYLHCISWITCCSSSVMQVADWAGLNQKITAKIKIPRMITTNNGVQFRFTGTGRLGPSRNSPQWGHLIAVSLMLSPQNGQSLVRGVGVADCAVVMGTDPHFNVFCRSVGCTHFLTKGRESAPVYLYAVSNICL